MSADLVLDPSQVEATLPEYNLLLDDFSYTSGNKYAEFMKGDKVAGYGLTALIAGGATAVAIKTGLFAKLWKFLAVAVASLWKFLAVIVAGIAAYIRKLFGKVLRRANNSKSPRQELPPAPQLQAASRISENDRN
jgi:uncharacterized membrane-anchored protein